MAPELALRQAEPPLEREALNALAVAVARFTPSVSLDPPDCVLIEVSACLKLFGGLHNIIREAIEQASALGFVTTHAAAPTPLAARWLAVFTPGRIIGNAPGWPEALDSLPVHALGCGNQVTPSVIDMLSDIGMQNLGQLGHLPRAGLARRQARSVLDTLARARGGLPDPRPWLILPPRFFNRLAMPTPTPDIEPLLFACDRLFAELAAWLKARHAGSDQCVLHLEYERHPASRLEIVPAAPTQDKRRWLTIARERLAVMPLAAPVEALCLEAEAPLQLRQNSGDLFGDSAEDDEAADRLLERLRARLGAQAVHSLRTWPDHRPEKAWRCAEPGADYPATPAKRPLWLLRQPKRLKSVETYQIEAGPERIESGWWDGEEVHRDYYVVRAPDASRLWIFQDIRTTRDWFVHGYFG